MDKNRWFGFFFVSLSALALAGCDLLFPSKDKDKNLFGENSYVFVEPRTGQLLEADSLFLIQWRTPPGFEDSLGLEDSTVRLDLYQGDTFLITISKGTENDGSYLWPVTSSNGTGDNYKVKISNASDTSLYTFSHTFSIFSGYTGGFTILAPEENAVVSMDSSMIIHWTSYGNPGNNVRILLYRDTALIRPVISMTPNNGVYLWQTVNPGLEPGDGYRIKIESATDKFLSGRSEPFTMRSQYYGGFIILNLLPGDTLAVDDPIPFVWSDSGNPGETVRVTLGQDTSAVLAWTVENTGTLSRQLPGNLALSGSYFLAVTSLENPALGDTVKSLFVNGVPPDAYEDDGSRDRAKTIWSGETQPRTLPLNDTDWVATDLDSGRTYLFSLNTPLLVSGNFYQPGKSSSVKAFTHSAPLIHTAEKTGRHHLKLEHSNLIVTLPDTAYGPVAGANTIANSLATSASDYALSFFPADSLPVTFTQPDSETVVEAGKTLEIRWDTTGTLLGSTVRLSVAVDTIEMVSITSTIPNSGEASWNIPSGFEEGRFRIKISDANQLLSAYSPPFTISEGIERDAFEYDNTREHAKPVPTDGTVQNRTLSYLDEDWTTFEAEEGKTYRIRVQDRYAQLSLTNASGTTLQIKIQNNPMLTFTADSTQRLYVRVRYASTVLVGPYQFSVEEIDPGAGYQRIQFTNPDSSTIWASGNVYTMSWNPDSADFGTAVGIALYRDTVRAATIATSRANTGSVNWAVTQGMVTSANYRLKIWNVLTPEIFGVSAPFSITGIREDPYEPDDDRENALAVKADGTPYYRSIGPTDTDWMSAELEGSKYYLARISGLTGATLSLYDESTLLKTLNGTDLVLAMNGLEGTHYVQVTASPRNYQFVWEEFSPDAILEFNNPVDSTIWTSGGIHSVSWSPLSGLFSGTVLLHLYKGTEHITQLGPASYAAGQANVLLPAGLATGGDYYVRLQPSQGNVFAHSPRFRISGLIPDVYEPNNSLQAATPIPANAINQYHGLTYKDADWFSFKGVPTTVYEIQTQSNLQLNQALYLDSGLTPATDIYTSAGRTIWYCSRERQYFFKMTATTTGDYSVRLLPYGPDNYRFNIAAPAAGSVVQMGDTLNIQWSSVLDMPQNIDIFLLKNGSPVHTVASDVANNNGFSWVLPASLVPGDDYSLRLISRFNANINGAGGVFSIR